MAVSYLQPENGFRSDGGMCVVSEWVERGEVLPCGGEGDRE